MYVVVQYIDYHTAVCTQKQRKIVKSNHNNRAVTNFSSRRVNEKSSRGTKFF